MSENEVAPIGFLKVNNDLISVAEHIQLLSHELTLVREVAHRKKAEFENAYAQHVLEAKASNPKMTQTELQARAENLAHQARMDYITADSAYHKVQNELSAKNAHLEALKEVSFNLRKEASII